jgi:hypothetical protein
VLFCTATAQAEGALAGLAATPPGPSYLPVVLSGFPDAGIAGFLETFTGAPLNPQPWRPAYWDVTVHTRQFKLEDTLIPMQADHGPMCEPPPATHLNDTVAGAVYLCRDHVMTAINDPVYGAIYLTPNQMVDFSEGTAVIQFDLSTRRTSGRDWIDLWITPFADHLQLPLDDWLPDLNGPPRRGLHIRMDFSRNNSIFLGEVIDNFSGTALELQAWQGYETILTPSATQRETFELQISQGYVKFGLPAYDYWWIDQTLPNLNWSEGVVQFAHHSYTPEKDCNFDGTCGPNTWHWDNVNIMPARPFTMIGASRRYLNSGTPDSVTLAQAAPANAYLRFAGIGDALEVSFNGGATWIEAVTQAQSMHIEDHFQSYWMPIPVGVSMVRFRGQEWYGGDWQVRDISVWSANPPIGEGPV